MKIYHNPRCGTSRKALQMILDAGLTPEIILYLKNPITNRELTSLLRKMKMEPSNLIRTKEEQFKTEYKNKILSDEAAIQIMIDHPKLMERPIIEYGKNAALGRPLENLIPLIEKATLNNG